MHYESIFKAGIRFCKTTQNILAYWLVLAFDLLEYRRAIDVIITKFFPLCFNMAESFENFENTARD